jgi:hypothetical protein
MLGRVMADTELVPNIVGLTEDAAILSLLNTDFFYGQIGLDYSSTVPYLHIMSQDPIAGSTVDVPLVEKILIKGVLSVGPHAGGGYPPQATNPTPVTEKKNLSRFLNQLTWEI